MHKVYTVFPAEDNYQYITQFVFHVTDSIQMQCLLTLYELSNNFAQESI